MPPFLLVFLLGCSPGAPNSTHLKLNSSYHPQRKADDSGGLPSYSPPTNSEKWLSHYSVLWARNSISLNCFSTSDQHPTSTGNKHWLFYFLSLNPLLFIHFASNALKTSLFLQPMFFKSFLPRFHSVVPTHYC